jgi:hypothetical protein
MFFENRNFADSERLNFLRQSPIVFAKLRPGMRIGRDGERNPLLHRQPDNFVRWIKFVDRFAPSRGGKLDGQPPSANNRECLLNQRGDHRSRAMPVDFHKIEMRQAIDQPAFRNRAHAAEIVGVDFIDVATGELFRAGMLSNI